MNVLEFAPRVDGPAGVAVAVLLGADQQGAGAARQLWLFGRAGRIAARLQSRGDARDGAGGLTALILVVSAAPLAA